MKRNSIILSVIGLMLAAHLLSGCGKQMPAAEPSEQPAPSSSVTGSGNAQPGGGLIRLNDSTAELDGSGAEIDGSAITIQTPGEYTISGTLTDGYIGINLGNPESEVTLIFNGAELHCSSGAAVRVSVAKKTELVLKEGTTNRIDSGKESDMALCSEESSGAAIYCEGDLSIRGGGILLVGGYLNNGITAKDVLTVTAGELTVTSANTGLKGTDGVRIGGGTITLFAGGDGIRSSAEDKPGKGGITVSGGTIGIESAGDAFSSAGDLRIEGGSLSLTTTGDESVISACGLKALGSITVAGGSVSARTTDHAIKADGDITVTAGTLSLYSSGGKGIRSHGSMSLSGAGISINAIEDAIESDGELVIASGILELTAGEDALHAASVIVSGGDICARAYRDVIDADSSSFTGGSLIGVTIAEEIKRFGSSAFPSLYTGVTGSRECTVRLTRDGSELKSLQAVYGFNGFVCISSELQAGVTYHVVTDLEDVSAKAR